MVKVARVPLDETQHSQHWLDERCGFFEHTVIGPYF